MKRFFRLPRRDQIALLFAVLALLMYGIWFGLLLPLQNWNEQQRQRTAATAQNLLQVQTLASDIQRLQKSGAVSSTAVNLSELVDRTLRENALSMSGFQPGRDGNVRLRLQSARFEALLQWLYELETRHQVRVGELSITPTQNAGLVTAQIQLLGASE